MNLLSSEARDALVDWWWRRMNDIARMSEAEFGAFKEKNPAKWRRLHGGPQLGKVLEFVRQRGRTRGWDKPPSALNGVCPPLNGTTGEPVSSPARTKLIRVRPVKAFV